MRILRVAGRVILGLLVVALIVGAGTTFLGPRFLWALGGLIGFLIALVVILLGVARLFGRHWLRLVAPNEVLVFISIFGQKVVTKGFVVVVPPITDAYCVPKDLVIVDMPLMLTYTADPAPVNMGSSLRLEVEQSEQGYRSVAAKYSGRTLEDTIKKIEAAVHGIVEDSQDTVMSGFLAKDIRTKEKRELFEERVLERIATPLKEMALRVVAYALGDVVDVERPDGKPGILATIERVKRAEIEKEAELAELEKGKFVAERKYSTETDQARARMNFLLQKANFDEQADRREAQAHMAYDLAQLALQRKLRQGLVVIARLVQYADTGVVADWARYKTEQAGRGAADVLRAELEEMAKHPGLAVARLLPRMTEMFPNLRVLNASDGGDFISKLVAQVPSFMEALRASEDRDPPGGTGKPSEADPPSTPTIPGSEVGSGWVSDFGAKLVREVEEIVAQIDEEEAEANTGREEAATPAA